MSCAFCDRIERGEYDQHYQNDRFGDVVRFEPLNPVTPGHMLFVPMIHNEWGNYSGSSVSAFWFATKYSKPFKSFNIITSCGSEATQTIPHIHVHFVPRTEGDGLHLPWTGQNDE